VKAELTCELEDGTVENASIGVFSYFDGDGRLKFSVVHEGDVPLTTFVGLLEVGKVELVGMSRDW
jgi:hypothetical protein